MKKDMKKIVKSIVLGAAALAIAGPASAVTTELNLYGASAQYTFWNAQAPSFLTSAAVGCTAASQAQDSSTKHGITIGTGCGAAHADTILFRYSAKASYDGPLAVANVNHSQADLACFNLGFPVGFRKMADETSISGSLVGTTKCVDVQIGASDVAVESFQQSSHGLLLGPRGGAQTDRSFNGIPVTGMTTYQPIVVPFGFFANSAIHVKKCAPSAGGSRGANVGNLCTAATEAADCGPNAIDNTAPGQSYPCVEKVIDDLSREMAVNIFSGQAFFWSDFGDSYTVTGKTPQTDDFIVACLRHAGSGTAAALDWAVMNHGIWGAPLANTQTTGGPTVWFNDGSSDLIKCVNGNNTVDADPNNNNGSLIGAVGYADSDQAVGVDNTSQNVVALTYNGVPGRRNTIRNGNYDFFTNQWLYENPAKTPVGSVQHTLITQLDAFAGNPANLTSDSSLGPKAAYWATSQEMVFNRATDKAYPGYQGATNKQSP